MKETLNSSIALSAEKAAGENNPKTATYLTKADVADLLRVTTRTVDQWMSRGLLPYRKIGRTVRFRASEIEAYLTEHFLVARRSFRKPVYGSVGGGAQ